MNKQLPAIVKNIVDDIDVRFVSEYGSPAVILTNIMLPIIMAKYLGIPIPDEMLLAMDDMLQCYCNSINPINNLYQ